MHPVVAVLVLTAALGAAAPEPASAPAPSTIETRDDGWFIHRPSGLFLPREIYGAKYTHIGRLTHVGPDGVVLEYGPITVTIGLPQPAADAVSFPAGMKLDPDPPGLPALLFWGEAAQPITVSFLHAADADRRDWLVFTIVVGDWEIAISALYASESRDEVIRTAEAVWANLASGNEREPR